MNYIEKQIVDGVRILPIERQQEVLDFFGSLKSKIIVKDTEAEQQNQHFVSFVEAAHKYAGCVDSGVTDLSTNEAYMKDFGRDSMGEGWEPAEELKEPISFAEAAREYIECLDGVPADLSTNKAYLEGLGQV